MRLMDHGSHARVSKSRFSVSSMMLSRIAFAERRAREIGEWLKHNKDITAWVAIDDVDLSWADGARTRPTPLMKKPGSCYSETRQ